MLLGELAGDPASAAEVGRGAPAHMASTSATMADVPSQPAGLAAEAPPAAPACRGLARRRGRAALLPEDVEVEEEAAGLSRQSDIDRE